MPLRLDTPLLTVDVGKLRKIDTRNVENLFSLWSVFKGCARAVDEGRRLENLSWRLWNRETFCCEPKPVFVPDSPTSSETPRPRSRSTKDNMPDLSSSVDSATSSNDFEQTPKDRSHSPSFRVKDLASSDDSSVAAGVSSSASSTRKGKPISPATLEKMVVAIKETKVLPNNGITALPQSLAEALQPSAPRICSADPTSRSSESTPTNPSQSQHYHHQEHLQRGSQQALLPTSTGPRSPRQRLEQRASQSSTSTVPQSSPDSTGVARTRTISSDTSAEMMSSHSIVRGFAPDVISSSHRSHTHLAPSPVPLHAKPMPKPQPGDIQAASPAAAAAAAAHNKKFLLGGSEDESSFDDQKVPKHRESSLTAALKRSPPIEKKTTFKEEIESRVIAGATASEDVFESDDEDEGDLSIEEDDEDDEGDGEDGDWEDSLTDSGNSSVDHKQLFQRVDSKPNLVSRRSLLTTMVHENERRAAMIREAQQSQTRSRNSSASNAGGLLGSESGSPEDDDDGGSASSALELQSAAVGRAPTSAMNDHPRSRPKPIIMTTSNGLPPALSPKTTRRNMLSSELTESLRKHLLWERQKKHTTAKDAALKRRHTAQDVANLQQYPEASGRAGGQGSGQTSKTNSWNTAFDSGLGEYNSRGW